MSPKDQLVILLAGGTGYVGMRLTRLLEQEDVRLRCFARTPDTLRRQLNQTTEIIQGDVLDPASLDRSLQGADTAFYLVHLVSGSKEFEKDDRSAAIDFARAAAKAGVRRIIYHGGLGDENDPELSPHLRSRHEVGQIFRTRSPFDLWECSRQFGRPWVRQDMRLGTFMTR